MSDLTIIQHESLKEETEIAAIKELLIKECSKQEILQIRFLKKKCRNCGYLIPDIDELEQGSCKDDPECTANRIKISFGRDPIGLAKKLAELMVKGDEEVNDAAKEKIFSIIRKRDDSMFIIEKASELFRKMKNEEKRKAVPTE